jgi:hypothetical protein
LIYLDGSKEIKVNDKPPPTWACHDIAHFICGFHKNLEWDYEANLNHIAEYNAVFVEHLLTHFSFHHHYNLAIDFKSISNQIFNYMKWFSEDYYKIKDDHPSKKNFLELQNDFFENINLNILSTHFISFYNTWAIQHMINSEDFKINIHMTNEKKPDIIELNSYILNVKSTIQSFI